MKQQPFTSDGVDAKQAELYALSDSDLQAQVKLVQSDFKSWMATNFSLDTLQTDSLNNLDDRFVSCVVAQLTFVLPNRLPIHIDKHGTESTGKLIHTSGKLSCSFDSTGFTADGSLDIDITYS